MAGLAGQGFAVGGTAAAVVAFGVAAVVILLLMFFIAAAVGSAQEGLLSDLKAGGAKVKRWGAYIMLAVGAWFLTTSAFPAAFVTLF